jgi:hypothetical protein
MAILVVAGLTWLVQYQVGGTKSSQKGSSNRSDTMVIRSENFSASVFLFYQQHVCKTYSRKCSLFICLFTS